MRVRHKTKSWEGRLIRTDGRLALVKWDNQSLALLIATKYLEELPLDLLPDPDRYFNGATFKEDEPNVGLGWVRQQFPEVFD